MKRRIISLLLTIAMMLALAPSGLFSLGISAADPDAYKEYHVDTFSELKTALEESTDQTKKIIVEKTISVDLDLNNTIPKNEANSHIRTAVNVVGKNILSFAKGKKLNITAKACKHQYSVGDVTHYSLVDYHIFCFVKNASLLIDQTEPDTSITVNAQVNCVLFDGLFYDGDKGGLSILGGTINFNVLNTSYIAVKDTYMESMTDYRNNFNGESVFASVNCILVSTNIFYRARPSKKGGYSGNICFEHTAMIYDSYIEMDAGPRPLTSVTIPDSYVFSHEYTALFSTITTKGEAELKSEYDSRTASSQNVYQNEELVDRSSYDCEFIGTTSFICKPTSEETTSLVYRDYWINGDRPDHDYVYYKRNYTGYAGVFYMKDSISVNIISDLPDFPGYQYYTYEAYNVWPVYRVVDGELEPVTFKPEVELMNGFYYTKNGEPLDLDRLDDAIEGGIKTWESYVVSGAFAIEKLKFYNNTITACLKVKNDLTIIGGVPVEETVYFPENYYRFIYSGYQYKWHKAEYRDEIELVTIWQKKVTENGAAVWKDVEEGSVITPGSYRPKFVIIPRNGMIFYRSVYVEVKPGQYIAAIDRTREEYPNDYYDFQDTAVICYSIMEDYIYPEEILSVTLNGAVDYGKQLGEILSVAGDSAELTASLWYHNGEIVPSDAVAGTGKYSALVKVETDEFHQFAVNATAKIFGETVQAESVSDDGKYIFFRTPTVTLSCDHADDTSELQSDANNHWHVCSVCGMTYGKEEHDFDDGVTSGSTTTYTCTECGYQKHVNNGKELIDWIIINTNPLAIGSKLPALALSKDDQDKISLVGYSWKAGSDYAGAAAVDNDSVVEEGKTYYLDADFTAGSEYYLDDSTNVRICGVSASDKTISAGGSQMEATVALKPVTAAAATVSLPAMTVGQTMEEVFAEIDKSLISQDFYGIELEIKENGVKNSYHKNIYISDWAADSESTAYGTFKSRTVQPGSTYSLKIHLFSMGTDSYVTEDNVSIKNKAFADSVSVTTNRTGVMTIAIYSTEGDSRTITNAILSVDMPVAGNTPASAAGCGGGHFTAGSISWSDSPAVFDADKAYTVTLTLQPDEGYSFDAYAGAFVNGSPASVVKSGENLIVTKTFPKTYKVAQTIAFEHEEVTVPYGSSVKETVSGGTAVTYSVSDGGDVASVNASTGEVTILKVGKAVIKATAAESGNYYAAEATYQLNVTKIPGPAAPSCTFSFDGANAGKLMGATPAMEYSLNGGLLWNDCTGDITLNTKDINDVYDIQVRVKATDTAEAGEVQTIDITKAALPLGVGATDCTTVANNDGTITGVSAAMEYKKAGTSAWTDVTGTTVTGLADGTYSVRYKAAGTALASEAVSATVFAHYEYTVTFDMNGHGTALSAQTVAEGDSAAKPETDPSADGWVFAGWYADADCSEEYDFDLAITANTTVYAKWIKYSAPITKIEITVPTPIVGKTRAESETTPTVVTTPADAVRIEKKDWWETSGEYLTGTFEAGKEYEYGVYLVPKDGYTIEFDGDDYLGELIFNGGTFLYTESMVDGGWFYATVKCESAAEPAVQNYTKDSVNTDYATVTFENSGKTAVVSCESACAVIAKTGENSYTRLKGVMRDKNVYTYDLSGLPAGFSLIVALRGDANMDGYINSTDLGQARGVMSKKLIPDDLKMLVMDLMIDDLYNSTDLGQLRAVLSGKLKLTWY